MLKKIMFILLIMFLTIEVYILLINPKDLNIIEEKVESTTISESFNGFKIVHFSDTLIKNNNDIKTLSKVVNQINELNPDIIVFTGDLISKDNELEKNDIEKIIQYLKKLKCTLYKYSVIGDNDKLIDEYITIMEKSNFNILDNLSTYIFYKDVTPIKLTGITDIDFIQEALIMDENLDTTYNIIITHYPDNIDKISQENIDLVLAGHSLNGQIRLPFVGGLIKYDGANKYIDNQYIVNNTKMFVNNGIGNNKTNFRLFNKPSINLYRLEKTNN